VEATADENARYGAAIALGALFIGAYVAEREKDDTRVRRMEVALADQVAALYEAFPDQPKLPDIGAAGLLARLPSDWPTSPTARTYLIDLYFTRPFAPAELKVNDGHREEALVAVAERVGLDRAALDRIKKTAKSAEASHRHKIVPGHFALIGGVAFLLLAVTAGAAAPLVAVAIGASAGLSGAAALTYGMAVLGFGSLAAGGLGMAGGLWIVTAAGGVLGGLGGTAAALVTLGPKGTRSELIKLQTTVVEVVLAEDKAEVSRIVGDLASKRDEVRAQRDEALQRNEDDAQAIEDLTEIEDALSDAMRWISDELSNA
jgi:hypothetical protein